MTLKRIHIEASQFKKFATGAIEAEPITDVSRVYSIEHGDHGHTILIMHMDGTATAYADQVRFLGSGGSRGAAFTPTSKRVDDEFLDDLAATMAELDKL